MIRVGLVGCGTIGSRLALTIARRYRKQAKLVAVYDTQPDAAAALQKQISPRPSFSSVPDLIHRCDLVIEAASAQAAGPLAAQTLRQGRSILVLSVGGLLMDQTWQAASRRSSGRVHVPSGALAGLDGVRALAISGVRKVVLRTSKPPAALASAPYVRARRISLKGLSRPKVIFRGSAKDVVRAFPQNTNVAASLTLASGLPASRVRVEVVADPGLSRNTHVFEVEGKAGKISCRIESEPSANPKTSELAILSAEALLERLLVGNAVGS